MLQEICWVSSQTNMVRVLKREQRHFRIEHVQGLWITEIKGKTGVQIQNKH